MTARHSDAMRACTADSSPLSFFACILGRGTLVGLFFLSYAQDYHFLSLFFVATIRYFTTSGKRLFYFLYRAIHLKILVFWPIVISHPTDSN